MFFVFIFLNGQDHLTLLLSKTGSKTKGFLTVSRLYRWIVIADETLSCFLYEGQQFQKQFKLLKQPQIVKEYLLCWLKVKVLLTHLYIHTGLERGTGEQLAVWH